MARNESVARMVMLLCFGTAILSLAVRWINQGQSQQLTSTVLKQNSTRTNSGRNASSSYKNTSGSGLEEKALGASLPESPPKLSAIKPHINRETRSKNVANVTDSPKKLRVVMAEPVVSSPTNALKSDQTQLIVDLGDRRVYVYRHQEVIASYPIAVGKRGWETPTGNFQVMHMEHHPIWRHPITGKVFQAGTDSPLGDRWIGFWSDGRNEIGFHGTPDIDLVGTAVSHGCLRMRNADVKLLYQQIGLGTPVFVRS